MMKNSLRAVFIRPALLVLVAIASVLLSPLSALAHARLVRSTPDANSELAAPPAKIDLWFSELLDKGFNSITVFSVADAKLAATSRVNFSPGDPRIDTADQTHLSVQLKPLAPGEYYVEWRVLSQDGHTAPGRFKFRVRAAGN